MNHNSESKKIFDSFDKNSENQRLLDEINFQGQRMLAKMEKFQQDSQEIEQKQWIQQQQEMVDSAREQGRILAYFYQLTSALEQSLVHLEQAQNVLQLDEMSGYPELSESVFYALHHCLDAINHLSETNEVD